MEKPVLEHDVNGLLSEVKGILESYNPTYQNTIHKIEKYILASGLQNQSSHLKTGSFIQTRDSPFSIRKNVVQKNEEENNNSIDQETTERSVIDQCMRQKNPVQNMNAKKLIRIDQISEDRSQCQMSDKNEKDSGRNNLGQIVSKFVIFDYDINNKRYNVWRKQKEIGGIQKVLLDMLLASESDHVRQIPNAQIDKYMGLIGRPLKPIIFEIVQGTYKYAYAYQTRQCKCYQNSSKFILFDRFFVFLSEYFVPMWINQIAKEVVGNASFEDRKKDKGNFEIKRMVKKSSKICQVKLSKELQKKMMEPLQFKKKQIINQSYSIIQSLQKSYSSPQKQSQIKLYSEQLQIKQIHLTPSSSKGCYTFDLILLVFYCILKDYKVVMIGWKDTRYVMSEVVFAVKYLLGEVQYFYPIILASICREHLEYVDAPIPGIMGFWGKDRRINQQTQKIKSSVNIKGSLEFLLINLNTNQTINPYLNDKDIDLLSIIAEFMKQCKEKTEIQKLRKFMRDIVIGRKGQEGWMEEVREIFSRSQLCQQFLFQGKKNV